MMIKYRTERLPLNFVALGAMLIAIGVWRIIVLDLVGIFLFLLGSVLFFLHFGIMIDVEKTRLMKYTGFLGLTKGEWEDISEVELLRIIESNESQTMHVLSIRRVSKAKVYKLYAIMPDRIIELQAGQRGDVLKRANSLSLSLGVSVEDDAM